MMGVTLYLRNNESTPPASLSATPRLREMTLLQSKPISPLTVTP